MMVQNTTQRRGHEQQTEQRERYEKVAKSAPVAVQPAGYVVAISHAIRSERIAS